MDALKLLQTRRSCRSYKSDMITDKEIKEIVDAGLNAPSAMNTQHVKIIVVKNKALRDELAKMNAEVWGKDMDPFYGAPVVCLIMTLKEDKNALQDGALVLGTMQYAAYALNIGSCWINRCIEMFESSRGKELLQEWQMEGYMGVGCCILGYPEKALPEKKIQEDRVKYID